MLREFCCEKENQWQCRQNGWVLYSAAQGLCSWDEVSVVVCSEEFSFSNPGANSVQSLLQQGCGEEG